MYKKGKTSVSVLPLAADDLHVRNKLKQITWTYLLVSKYSTICSRIETSNTPVQAQVYRVSLSDCIVSRSDTLTQVGGMWTGRNSRVTWPIQCAIDSITIILIWQLVWFCSINTPSDYSICLISHPLSCGRIENVWIGSWMFFLRGMYLNSLSYLHHINWRMS